MFDPWRREPGWVIAPLLAMQTAAFALDIGKESSLQTRLTFPNAGKAEQAEAAADDAIALVRIFMLGRARQELRREIEDVPNPTVPMFISLLIKQFEDGMRGVKVMRKGSELSASAEAKIDIAAIKSRTRAEAAAILADEAGRLARNRRTSVNNLKQLALAIQSFHDLNRMLPPPAICSKKDGTPLLSWRVMVLPYVDEAPLFNEFKLDEPWDSAQHQAIAVHAEDLRRAGRENQGGGDDVLPGARRPRHRLPDDAGQEPPLRRVQSYDGRHHRWHLEHLRRRRVYIRRCHGPSRKICRTTRRRHCRRWEVRSCRTASTPPSWMARSASSIAGWTRKTSRLDHGERRRNRQSAVR